MSVPSGFPFLFTRLTSDCMFLALNTEYQSTLRCSLEIRDRPYQKTEPIPTWRIQTLPFFFWYQSM